MTSRVTQQEKSSHIKNVSQPKTFQDNSQTSQYHENYPTKASQYQDNVQPMQRASQYQAMQEASQNQEATPFKAAQLHLSETRDSDVSTGDENKTISSRSDFSSHSEEGENVRDVEKQQQDDLVKNVLKFLLGPLKNDVTQRGLGFWMALQK